LATAVSVAAQLGRVTGPMKANKSRCRQPYLSIGTRAPAFPFGCWEVSQTGLLSRLWV
jgi:hypothetical protein